jgi:hypothetical protein
VGISLSGIALYQQPIEMQRFYQCHINLIRPIRIHKQQLAFHLLLHPINNHPNQLIQLLRIPLRRETIKGRIPTQPINPLQIHHLLGQRHQLLHGLPVRPHPLQHHHPIPRDIHTWDDLEVGVFGFELFD